MNKCTACGMEIEEKARELWFMQVRVNGDEKHVTTTYKGCLKWLTNVVRHTSFFTSTLFQVSAFHKVSEI